MTGGRLIPFRHPEVDRAELESEITRTLEVTGQWVRHFYPSDVDGIAAARSAGRRAGRSLGVKIITRQSDPTRRDDGQVVVIVVVDEDLPPRWPT